MTDKQQATIKAKKNVKIDKLLHQDIKIAVAMLDTEISEFVEFGARKLLSQFDDGLLTEDDFKKEKDDSDG
jgi:hypothetical protein